MCPATARARLRASAGRPPRATLAALVVSATLVLGACSGEEAGASAEPDESPSATASSDSATVSPSPTQSPEPEAPNPPAFAPGRAGKRAFVEHIVAGWGYGLQTNDASPLLDASGRKPCRGCDTYRRELRQREREGWYVQFPGATVRKVSFRPDGPVEVGTVVADIPASQSFFDDGAFRNDNEAHKGATFLIDIRADGQGKGRHWTLLAFTVK